MEDFERTCCINPTCSQDSDKCKTCGIKCSGCEHLKDNRLLSDEEVKIELLKYDIPEVYADAEVIKTVSQIIAIVRQAQLNKLLNPEWLDKPDSEGWWWYEGVRVMPLWIEYDKATKCFVVYQVRNGLQSWLLSKLAGKWSKAFVPKEGE